MRFTILSFLCLVTVIAYVQRCAFNGATKTIEASLSLNPADMGVIMGGWYLAYAVCQVPSGLIADRMGSKRALLLFATAWSVLTGLVGLSLGFTGLFLFWVLMGVAQAGIFPCCTKAIGAVFPRAEQAFASGMLASCMSLGAGLAPAITSQLLGPLSWQALFLVYALPGLVWALGFALVVSHAQTVGNRSDTPTDREPSAELLDREDPITRPWSRLVTDPQMLILCAQQFFRAGPMALFFTWFARVLTERGLTESQASGMASWPPFVGAFGGVAGGLISDWLLARTGNSRLARQGMTFCALITGSAVSLAAYFTPDNQLAVVLMSVASFCGMAGGVSGYSLAIGYGGRNVATVFSVMNMSGNLGATFFPVAVGWIVKEGNSNNVLLLFAAMFVTGAVCWAVLNPKGTLFDEPKGTS